MADFVPEGYLTLSAAIDRVRSLTRDEELDQSPATAAEDHRITERRRAASGLRQRLFAGQIPSQIITRDGSLIEIPNEVWGSDEEWEVAISSNRVTFSYGYNGSISGRVLIPKDALEAAFQPDGAAREGNMKIDVVETAPRHQYRTHLLEILDRLWSEIDATNWQKRPPKKVAIVADCKNRFNLSLRDANAIATLFTPDNRRGKSKKG